VFKKVNVPLIPEALENYSDIHSPFLPLLFLSRQDRDARGIPQETKPNFELGLRLCKKQKPFLGEPAD